MPNNNFEQQLIDTFLSIYNDFNDIELVDVINSNCKSKKFADIEFITTNEHWVIEAKSNFSADSHNSVHKVFGELLKETGKTRVINNGLLLKYGILIPNKKFYRDKFRQINRDKFIEFGRIIPVCTIFVLEENVLTKFNWTDFYDDRT